jgi:hypothetical protein
MLQGGYRGLCESKSADAANVHRIQTRVCTHPVDNVDDVCPWPPISSRHAERKH